MRHEDGVENLNANDSSSDENTDYIGGMIFPFCVIVFARVPCMFMVFYFIVMEISYQVAMRLHECMAWLFVVFYIVLNGRRHTHTYDYIPDSVL